MQPTLTTITMSHAHDSRVLITNVSDVTTITLTSPHPDLLITTGNGDTTITFTGPKVSKLITLFQQRHLSIVFMQPLVINIKKPMDAISANTVHSIIANETPDDTLIVHDAAHAIADKTNDSPNHTYVSIGLIHFPFTYFISFPVWNKRMRTLSHLPNLTNSTWASIWMPISLSLMDPIAATQYCLVASIQGTLGFLEGH